MRYLIAILLPPLAVFSCGKLFQAILNIPLTLFFYLPGLLHALLVVNAYNADQRNRQMIKALGGKDPGHKSFRMSLK